MCVLCCCVQNDAALIDFLVSDGQIVAIVGGVVPDIAYVIRPSQRLYHHIANNSKHNYIKACNTVNSIITN